MSLNQHIVRFAPWLLRAYRTRFLLDLPVVLAHLPLEGRIVDVGCAVGSTDYTIARLRPGLDITGIDIDGRVVEQANRHNSAPNVRYLARPLEEMDGKYDCITFIDILHHVTDAEARKLLAQCPRLIAPGGYVFIKEVDKRGGRFSYAMDRYVAFADPVRLRTADEIKALVPDRLKLVSERRKWKFPTPHLFAIAAVPFYLGSAFLVKAFGRAALILVLPLLGLALALIGSVNYNTYFDDYADFNAFNSGNFSEYGALFRSFEAAGGDLDNAYLKDRPHFIDGRILKVVIGDLDWSNRLSDVEEARQHALNPGAKLYVVALDDETSLLRLREIHPRGSTYKFASSKSGPLGDYGFFVILVPAEGAAPMTPLPNTHLIREGR